MLNSNRCSILAAALLESKMLRLKLQLPAVPNLDLTLTYFRDLAGLACLHKTNYATQNKLRKQRANERNKVFCKFSHQKVVFECLRFTIYDFTIIVFALLHKCSHT